MPRIAGSGHGHGPVRKASGVLGLSRCTISRWDTIVLVPRQNLTSIRETVQALRFTMPARSVARSPACLQWQRL